MEYFNAISNDLGFALDFTDDTVVVVETPEYFKMINELVFNSNK